MPIKTWLLDQAANLLIHLLAPVVILAIGACYLYDTLTGKETAL